MILQLVKFIIMDFWEDILNKLTKRSYSLI
jgi:hypothetical protein